MLASALHPGWSEAMPDASAELARVERFLHSEQQEGRPWLPAEPDVLRAFRSPPSEVRVLIIGQDPYPTAGHPIGLAFAVDRAVRPIPRGLRNIYRELADDVGVAPPEHGDLGRWSEQGVMLLNRVLTVQPGVSGSHRGHGWEGFTEQAVRALVARDQPLVAVLWGKDAARLVPVLGDTPVVASVHPSPLSASRGFFGSRPFSRVNALLETMGAEPVDWSLD